MKRRGFRIARVSALALVAAIFASLLNAPAAHAAGNFWALRHDGPVSTQGGAWNSSFVAAGSAGASPLIANRGAIGLWETFDFVLLGNNNIALKSKVNGKYVSDQNSAEVLIASATGIGQYEYFYVDTSGLTGGHFRLIDDWDRYVRLRSDNVLMADSRVQSTAGIFLQWQIS